MNVTRVSLKNSDSAVFVPHPSHYLYLSLRHTLHSRCRFKVRRSEPAAEWQSAPWTEQCDVLTVQRAASVLLLSSFISISALETFAPMLAAPKTIYCRMKLQYKWPINTRTTTVKHNTVQLCTTSLYTHRGTNEQLPAVGYVWLE